MRKVLVIALLALISLSVPHGAFGDQVKDSILKGNQWVRQRDYPKAIKEYKHAVQLDPKNAKAHLLLGLAYANTDELDEAVRHGERAIVIEPSYTAYYNLGLIYEKKGEHEKALDAYQKALQLNPSSYQVCYQLGLLHANRQRFNEAILAYKKALELNPRFAHSYLGLGSSYYRSGNKAAALEQVHRLTLLNEKDKAAALESWIKKKDAQAKT